MFYRDAVDKNVCLTVLSLSDSSFISSVGYKPRYQEMMHTRVFARSPDNGRQTIAICYQDTIASGLPSSTCAWKARTLLEFYAIVTVVRN